MVTPVPGSSDYAMLILAAGASRRMGRAKQLLPWGGATLLEHTLDQVRNVGIRRKYLLLGSRAEQIIQEVDITGFIPLIFAGWEEGMGSGIAYAVTHMLYDLPALKGVMITLADQPEVDTALLADMIKVHQASAKPLLACTYEDRAGVPAIISGAYVKDLQHLEGDRGARMLLEHHGENLERYFLSKPLTDIDDPASYRLKYREHFGEDPLL